jgi:hypothetical protein
MLARMFHALRVGGPAVLALAVVAAPATSSGPLDEKAIKAALEQLDEGIDEEAYGEIRAALQQLAVLYPELTARDTKKVVKLVKAVFSKVRPRKEQPGSVVGLDRRDPFDTTPVEDESRGELLLTYRLAVGLMFDKPEGEVVLRAALKLEHVKSWVEVQSVILSGLGFRADPGLTKLFADYLDHAQPYIAGTAAESLGQLAGQSLVARRAAVKVVVDAYSDAEAAAAKEARKIKEDDPTPAADRLAILWVAFNEALKALTGEGHEGPTEWREWFDAHGKGSDW